MTVPIFQSFRSTVSGYVRGERAASFYVLEDPITGAPVGLQSPRGNGPQGIWAPVDLTSAQIASPTAAMLADLNATYRLNVAPWTRYQSDGSALQPVTAGGIFVPLAGGTMTGALVFSGAMLANGNVYVPTVITDPTEELYAVRTNNLKTVTAADNGIDVLGVVGTLSINVASGKTNTSSHDAGVYGHAMAYGAGTGTVNKLAGVEGFADNEGNSHVLVAASFSSHPPATLSGTGSLDAHYAFYDEGATVPDACAVHYGGYFQGKIGVNTATPTADFHARENTAGTSVMYIAQNASGSNSATADFGFMLGSTTVGRISSIVDVTNSSYAMVFGTGSGASLYSMILTSTGAGNEKLGVGLNGAVPTATIDANTDIKTRNGVYKVGNTQVVSSRNTGWSPMTGSADKPTVYDTASVTLPQLAGRVMALQAALTTHGLIGA